MDLTFNMRNLTHEHNLEHLFDNNWAREEYLYMCVHTEHTI